MKMTKQQLMAQLDFIKQEIEADDSFEGSFLYSAMQDGLAPGEFHVEGAVRTGNRDGQGGLRCYDSKD